jgi:DNA modification methylase
MAGNEDNIHPTQKPVAIFARPMEWHLNPGELCYEPFCGSGTSIVAAETLGRRCYAMEKSPEFCDVILSRWEQATGETAVRLESGLGND